MFVGLEGIRLICAFSGVWAYFLRTLLRAKLWLYTCLTAPGDRENQYKIRFFRFGIPLVFKCTERLYSTEADALEFLNRVVPHLPIPKLVDSFQLDDASYCVMTKLPGDTLMEMAQPPNDIDPDLFAIVKDEILSVINDLWRIPQPPELAEKVMVSASGGGLPHPGGFYEEMGGPYDSTRELYTSLSLGLEVIPPAVLEPIFADQIVWQPADLALQNVLVHNGHLSGIIDWEDAGWFPRHWLLHRLRNLSPTCRGLWARYWNLTHKFDPAVEEAYRASKTPGVVYFPI